MKNIGNVRFIYNPPQKKEEKESYTCEGKEEEEDNLLVKDVSYCLTGDCLILTLDT